MTEEYAAWSQQYHEAMQEAAERWDRSMPRSCGSCSVCCIAPSIEYSGPSHPGNIEVTKDAGTPCEHLNDCGSGCGVYNQRPAVCRFHQCTYTVSGWHEDARPDRSGVYFTTENAPPSLEGVDYFVHIMVNPFVAQKGGGVSLVRAMLADLSRNGRYAALDIRGRQWQPLFGVAPLMPAEAVLRRLNQAFPDTKAQEPTDDR